MFFVQEFYSWSIEYLDKWSASFQADFSKEMIEWFLCSRPMSSNSVDSSAIVSFDAVLQCARRFLPDIAEEEQLFDQVVELNETLSGLIESRGDPFTTLSVPKKWEILLRNKNISLIAKLVDTVFSVPCSNAFCERIFSLMNIQWTDERNRLDFSTVSAILCVILNSDNMKCSDMVEFLRAQKDIEHLLKSSAKY